MFTFTFKWTCSLYIHIKNIRQLVIVLFLSSFCYFLLIKNFFAVDVEHSHVRFLGNLVLNLWDCGGQEAFMENYFASQRDNIFRNVEVIS